MGDALTDIYKIWHHPKLRKEMNQLGWDHYWKSIDLWTRDIMTGELINSSGIEHFFRFIRTGFTASKIAANASTVMLHLKC
jgi:hypothetical protein